MASSAVLIEGYLEKKKRRALQGYAKRYFILDNNGTLSYSRVQGEKVRDSVDLRKCSVGRSKKRRQLVIDSGDKVPWHCKALSSEDFERWTAAFHTFAQVQEEDTRPRSGSVGNKLTKPNERLVNDQSAAELVRLITQMTPSINNLARIASSQQHQQQQSQPSSSFGVSTLVGAVESVASTITGATSSSSSANDDNDKRELAKNVASLRQIHQRILDLIQNAHLAPDRQSSDSLDRAESIYHDAESAGSTYELDEDDLGTSDASSSLLSDSSSSTSSETSDDDDSFYESGEEGTDDDAASSASDRTQHASSTGNESKQVKRRTRLPHPIAGNEVSLFSLLKKNMGKDLSKVAFPVSMNEPLSALQSMAESLQYTELLDQAARMSDSSERLLYITVFAITTYSKYKYRSSRKPFNPMLGETYELVRPDKGLKFVSEKVSHHPNWLAAYAEGKGWDYTATESGQQKFWGRSMEILPEGIAEVRIKETGELYTFSRPPSYIRNIMSGEKYIEHVGDLEVSNTDTGEYAVVSFKEGSSWGGASSRNKIEGTIFDANDKAKIEIQGKWDEYVSRKTGGKSSETIWQIADFPKDAPKWYGFSEWTIGLNEITDDIIDCLPPTDSRLRPDQRALENGDVDTADVEKQKLEQKQRERRQRWENLPDDQKPPQFFKEEEDGAWHYTGGYWERREKKAWRKEIQVFEM